MKYYIFCLLVFMSGGICYLNISGMLFGFPEHYNGGWHKAVFAALIGIIFAYNAKE